MHKYAYSFTDTYEIHITFILMQIENYFHQLKRKFSPNHSTIIIIIKWTVRKGSMYPSHLKFILCQENENWGQMKLREKLLNLINLKRNSWKTNFSVDGER